MTAKNIAIVGLRLLAIYCFIEAVQMLTVSGMLGFVNAVANPEIFDHHQVEAMMVTAIPGGTLLVFAILLYVFSRQLAHRLAPPDVSEPKEMVCSFEQFQAVLFAVAGILILAMALPGLGRGVQQLFTLYRSHETGQHYMSYYGWFYFGGVVVQAVVGLVLVLNPRGFGNAWRWLRTAGT